jgi:hypothetical protein
VPHHQARRYPAVIEALKVKAKAAPKGAAFLHVSKHVIARRAQPDVAISEIEQNACFYREKIRKSGGFPRQCEHWLGMTPLF